VIGTWPDSLLSPVPLIHADEDQIEEKSSPCQAGAVEWQRAHTIASAAE